MANVITGDYALDARLERRLKRRTVSNQQRARSSSLRTAKKNAQDGDFDLPDDEYGKFLNDWTQFVDDSDGGADAKFVDYGHRKNNNGALRCKWSDEGVDPQYKMFFQHLIKNGKSYMLKISSVNEMEMFVKYEEEDQSSDGRQSSLKNDQKRQNIGTTRTLRSASRKEKTESPVSGHKRKTFEGLNACSRGIEETPLSGSPAKESQVFLFEEGYSPDCAKPTSHRQNRKSNVSTGIGSLGSFMRPRQSDSESDMADEDYMIFMKDLFYDDDYRLLYTPVGRSTVDEDDESTSDSEVVMMDTGSCKPSCPSFARKSCPTTVDVDSGKCLQSSGTCSHSDFRERLMKDLKKPFDHDEYKSLLEEASCCRALVRHRELRNGAIKSYPLDSYAKSYLDLYGELSMKIKSASYDHPRILNLLRGFFFWLKNLSHEDAFQPWMDPSCLNVLPQS